MQQEAAAGLVIQGSSNYRNLAAGHKFTLDKHFNANGAYVLTAVRLKVAKEFRLLRERFAGPAK